MIGAAAADAWELLERADTLRERKCTRTNESVRERR